MLNTKLDIIKEVDKWLKGGEKECREGVGGGGGVLLAATQLIK